MKPMKIFRGYFLVYVVLGALYLFILFVLLIPERRQMAAENEINALKTSSAASSTIPASYADAVGRHMILPEGIPTAVPIDNPDELKVKQGLFTMAEKGDVLLVFTNKVILYRPLVDRIVEVAQIRGK